MAKTPLKQVPFQRLLKIVVKKCHRNKNVILLSKANQKQAVRSIYNQS